MRITLTALAAVAGLAITLSAQNASLALVGARVIVGDGRIIDNAIILINGGRITEVRPAGGAVSANTIVNIAGKTVMPTIVDTHVHLSVTREAVEQDLRRRAAYGISGAMSLGQDAPELITQVRALGIIP